MRDAARSPLRIRDIRNQMARNIVQTILEESEYESFRKASEKSKKDHKGGRERGHTEMDGRSFGNILGRSDLQLEASILLKQEGD
jgi:hypothetical protein